jgi:phosphodiesterase/alkaline phosphatase D-like protein
MSTQKIILGIVIGLLAVAGVVGGIFAVRTTVRYLTHGRQPAGQPINLSVVNVTQDRVTATWTTNEEVLSLVQYGTTPSALNQTQSELSSTTNHRLIINQLEPDTKYFFKVQVGQEVFDDDGKPYTFTTETSSQVEFSEESFRQAFGSSDPEFDLNKDGIVNTHDFSLYLQQQGSKSE